MYVLMCVLRFSFLFSFFCFLFVLQFRYIRMYCSFLLGGAVVCCFCFVVCCFVFVFVMFDFVVCFGLICFLFCCLMCCFLLFVCLCFDLRSFLCFVVCVLL